MGKRMDTALVLIISFLGMFLILYAAGKDVRLIAVLSGLSTFCAGVIFHHAVQKARSNNHRRKRTNAVKQVKSLVYKDNASALSEIADLIQKKYNIHSFSREGDHFYFKEGCDESFYELCVIRKFKASPDDILSLWRESKKRKPIKGILFAVPGKIDTDALSLKYKMDHPKVLILESGALKGLYKKYASFQETPKEVKRFSIPALIKSSINRKRAFRYLAYALILITYFLFSGNMIHLAVGALLSFVSIFSFFSLACSDRLF